MTTHQGKPGSSGFAAAAAISFAGVGVIRSAVTRMRWLLMPNGVQVTSVTRSRSGSARIASVSSGWITFDSTT